MKSIVTSIEHTVAMYVPVLESLDTSVMDFKTPPRWSKKEILGHLVDSAQNNIQRFVRSQYECIPKIVYDQDRWVSIQHYQDYELNDLIALWSLLNRHLCRILANMDAAFYEKPCDTGKSGIQLHSLRTLAVDYLEHMKHHLRQIAPIPGTAQKSDTGM